MDGVKMLQRGELNIAEIGSPPATFALSSNVPVEIIYVTFQESESNALLVRNSMRTKEDLPGKTIATPLGSTSHYQLLFFLNMLDLANKVTIKFAKPSELIDLWRRGEIDGAYVWVRHHAHLPKMLTFMSASTAVGPSAHQFEASISFFASLCVWNGSIRA